MKDIINKINSTNWNDWSLDSILIDYDEIKITLSYDSLKFYEISLINYIGFQYIGHWDEDVIEDINISFEGNLIDLSLQKINKLYGEKPLPGGGVKNIEDKWLQMVIKMIDSNELVFTSSMIKINEIKG